MQENTNKIANNMQKYIFNFYAVFIMAIIPLLITPWRKDIFNDYRIIAAAVVSVIIFAVTLYYAKQHEFNLLDKLLVIYAIIMILSTVFSKDINLSLFGLPRCREGIFSLLTYLIIFSLFYKYFNFSKKSLNIILLSASIIAVYGILQYFKIDPVLNIVNNEFRGSVTSTIGQRNFVGTYCTLLIPICIGLFISSGKKIYFIVTALMFGLLFSSTTRSAWISFIFYGVIFIIYSLINIKNRKFIIRVFVLLITAVLIFNFMNYANKNMLTKRAKTVYTDAANITNNDSGSSRIFIWKKAIPFLFKNPLLGSGPDTYELVLNDAESKKRALYYKAHNEYLQIVITEGYLALAVYILIVLIILFRLFKSRKKGIHMWILFSCIAGYLIQAFFNISFISTAVIYWGILGIAANYVEPNLDKQLRQS